MNELHLKLRKVESSCDEAAMMGRSTSVVTSASPSNSKFHKNLKKIKRNHGSENPTKNYYLAFPALSSKKATTTITSGGSKASSPVEVGGTKKDSNLQLLCWSNLMSGNEGNSKPPTYFAHEELRNVVKVRPKRKRRYGRTTRSGVGKSNDVQCNVQSFDEYNGTASSPKARNGSKKNQRNQYGMKK